MDLFPDGGFVRLRNRARDKYLHADEDASGVSLRPLGAAPFRNLAWKVEIRPVHGGDDLVLLLQGAAYGQYLASAHEDEVPPPGVRGVLAVQRNHLLPNEGEDEDEDEAAPSGHGGVRAVQRDYTSMNLDPPFMWRAARVEAGENYVRLRNFQRYLRANGRHRRYRNINNLVTVDVRNGDETTMMQWWVEAIPSTPELLPLPSPPQPPDDSCCVCHRKSSDTLCCRCIEGIKSKLLAVAKERMDSECAQKNYYCLECREIFTGSHTEHPDNRIPIGHYKNNCVAWVTGEELWRAIFQAIETKDRAIRPYQLYKSDDPRCTICLDTLSADLYGPIFRFCSLKCYVAGAGGQEIALEKAIVEADFSGDMTGFCLTCATAGGGKDHKGHDWVRVRASSSGSGPGWSYQMTTQRNKLGQ